MTEASRPDSLKTTKKEDPDEGRLGSWKAIANYLGRTVRTVQRWEKSADLPVRRIQHESGSSVYAYRHELDRWLTRKNLVIIPSRRSKNSPVRNRVVSNKNEMAVEPETAHKSPEPITSQPASLLSRRPWQWALALAVVFLLVAWRAYTPAPPDTIETPKAMIARTLTTKPGVERSPALSPDGVRVAYIWETTDGQTDLHLRLVDVDDYVQLTDDDRVEESPAWSPDGLALAFLRQAGNGLRELIIIPAIGGNERILDTVKVTPVLDTARSMSASLTWHPSGEWIALVHDGGARDTSDIVAISLESGEKRLLTQAPDGHMDLAPAFSPQGDWLAFTRTGSAHNGQLFRTPVDLESTGVGPGEVQPLPSATPWDTDPVWTTDGSELIFSGGRWPKSRLWRMPSDGSGSPLPVAGTGKGGGSPSIAMAMTPGEADRTWRLAYSSVELDNDIWTLSLKDGEIERFLGSSQRERYPAFSNDGQRVVFLSDRSGFREVWSSSRDKPDPMQWTDWRSSYVWRPIWSPDNQWLAYTVQIDGKMRAFIQDRPLGSSRELSNDLHEDADITWSRDGRSLYSLSPDRRNGQPGVYRLSLDGSPPELMFEHGGRPLGENTDGRELFMNASVDGNVTLASGRIADGSIRVLDLQPARRHSFSAGPDGIYFVAVDDSGPQIRRWSFQNEKEELVTRISQEPEDGMAIDQNGQTAVVAMINIMRGDLMLAEGLPQANANPGDQ